MGEWKAYRQEGHPLELYNLKNDPRETNDLAKEHPDIVVRVNAIIKESHRPIGK